MSAADKAGKASESVGGLPLKLHDVFKTQKLEVKYKKKVK